MNMKTDVGVPNLPDAVGMSWKTAAFTVFLCVLFGANAVAIKVSFQGFGVFAAAALRFAMAAAVIALWARATGRSFHVPRDRRVHLLVYSLLFSVQLSLFYTGISLSQASRATLIVNSLPFMVLVFSHFFLPGDRITPRKVAGILLGFSGVAALTLDGNTMASEFRTGDGLCLLATTIWAANTVFLKRFIGALKPFQVVLYSMLVAVPVVLVASLLLDPAVFVDPAADSVLALLYQTLVTAAFGFIAWNTLLQRYGAVALHTYLFLIPPVGVVLAGWILKEPVNAHILASMALIATGILVVHTKPQGVLEAYTHRKSM